MAAVAGIGSVLVGEGIDVGDPLAALLGREGFHEFLAHACARPSRVAGSVERDGGVVQRGLAQDAVRRALDLEAP